MPPPENTRWFAENVQPHEPALRAYLLSRFSTLPDHDDVVQETYLRVLRVRWRLRVATARAFVFAIAGNLAIDRFRRRRVANHVPIDVVGELPGAETPDAGEALERRQRHESLAEAMAALSPRCREVMLLRYGDGLPCKEIARRLGVSTETVKSHLAKGVGDCIDFFQRQGLLDGELTRRKVS